MKKLSDFIEKNEVEYNVDRISSDEISSVSKETDVKFGDQLIKYILHCGYLAFKSIEFYGINSRQGLNSNMIRQTKYLHKYFPCTRPFVALENHGEGDYFLVDGRDNVFEFIPEHDSELKDTGKKLFEHILSRFEEES